MFDNKTMLLIVLGLVVFLLTRPSKNNTAKTDQTETEVTTETPVQTETVEMTESPTKPTESETVENFGNVDSQRVDTKYSSYPFLKEDCVDDSCPDVEFEADDVVTESDHDHDDKDKEELKAKPHTERVDVKGTNVKVAYEASGLAPGCDASAIPDNRTANLNKDDLLPGEATKDWFEQVLEIDDSALIKSNTKEFFGRNTVGSSLRNASKDIRGEVGLANPIRKYPWNNSTITPDNNLKNGVLCNN